MYNSLTNIFLKNENTKFNFRQQHALLTIILTAKNIIVHTKSPLLHSNILDPNVTTIITDPMFGSSGNNPTDVVDEMSIIYNILFTRSYPLSIPG